MGEMKLKKIIQIQNMKEIKAPTTQITFVCKQETNIFLDFLLFHSISIFGLEILLRIDGVRSMVKQKKMCRIINRIEEIEK